MKKVESFLSNFSKWSQSQESIIGVFLVGSHARDSARVDSDVDLVVITDQPEKYLSDHTWLSSFGSPEKIVEEDWGLVQALRVFFQDNFEVEFGITTEEWIQRNPVDYGTKKVLLDGNIILVDRYNLLTKFLEQL